MKDQHETTKATPAALREKVTNVLLTLTIRQESAELVSPLATIFCLERLPPIKVCSSPPTSVTDHVFVESCKKLEFYAFESKFSLQQLLAFEGMRFPRRYRGTGQTLWKRVHGLWEILAAASADPRDLDTEKLAVMLNALASYSRQLWNTAVRRLPPTPAQRIAQASAPFWQAVQEEIGRRVDALIDDDSVVELLRRPYIVLRKDYSATKAIGESLVRLSRQLEALPSGVREAIAAEAKDSNSWVFYQAVIHWGAASQRAADQAANAPAPKSNGRPTEFEDHDLCSSAHLAYELMTGRHLSKAQGSAFVSFLTTLLVSLSGPKATGADHARYLARRRLEKAAQAA